MRVYFVPYVSCWQFFHKKVVPCGPVMFFSLESIIAFAWEPNGSKFAVLHGESPRINASFYHVKNNGKIELISKSCF